MKQLLPSLSRSACGVLAMLLILGADMLHAQPQAMDIGPHARVYTASQTRGYWFTAPTDFYIVGLRVPTDAGTANQNIQVMRYNSPVTVWGTTGYDFTTLGYWYNVPGTGIIPCQILVQQGDIIGILGARGNTGSSQSHSYGNANVSTSIFGQSTTLVRHGTQWVINDGIPAGGTPHGTSKPTWTEPYGSIARVELYYEPPCDIPDGSLSAEIVDASGARIGFTEIPSNIWVKYAVRYPPGASNVTVRLEFREIGDPTAPPAFVHTVNDVKQAGQDLENMQMLSLPSTLSPGYYLVTPIINSLNSCDEYQDSELDDQLLLLIPPGTTLCAVWPGDVNNDGIVNYADRRDLNQYIHDANLRSSWLEGPRRYRHDAETNPLTFIQWERQPGIPWQTPEGCYMDSDGNGVINNFDYIAIKLNWNRAHGAIAPRQNRLSAATFDMEQNFPNPFNPETTLRYNVPERSRVYLVVTDALGRQVSTLVDDEREAGLHGVRFESSGASSGQYFATITMVGLESGLSFSKTVSMTLAK